MDVCMYGWVTSFFGFGGCLLKEERRDLLSLGNFLFLGGKAREQNFAVFVLGTSKKLSPTFLKLTSFQYYF